MTEDIDQWVRRYRADRRLRARSGLRPPRKLAVSGHVPRHARRDPIPSDVRPTLTVRAVRT